MKKLIVLSLVLTFFVLISDSAFATPPINEKIIQYRYYIKTITQMPEFKNDFTLPLENDFTKIFLEAEIEKTYENYNEILNYIDCKSTSEIVVYDEFLKQLKEKLASKGIFPSKFDEIKTNMACIYTPVFDSFPMESKNHPEYNGMVPENVQKTRRIFPYLYSKFFITKNVKAMKKIFEDFKVREDEEQNAAYFYKEASRLLANAYSSYCDENYQASCTAFGESIPYWRKYYELSNVQQDKTDYVAGMIKLLQGLSAIEYDYDYAKNIFKDSIGNFYGDFAYAIFYSHCFIAEIYYRQNDIKKFIDYYKNNVPRREFISNSSFSIMAKGLIIKFEYERLSKPFICSTQEDIDARGKISNLIAYTESNIPNDAEGRYVKKTLTRYKEIMAKNSLEIKAVGFDKYSASTKHYIKLKNHEDDQVIQTPQWLVKNNPNDNTVKLEIQSIAAVRNEKIRIQVVFGAQESPADIIGSYKITGYDVINKIGFNMLAIKKNKSNLLIEFESDKEISKTVGIFLLDINWHLIKPERKETSSIIKDFFIGNTQHTIYIVRKYIEEPCYCKIVEHTCDWMKNLSESDLDDDEKIVLTIWNNCTISELSDLNYYFLKALPNADTLAHLLKEQNGGSKAWADFLIHAFQCQGINVSGIYKLNFEAINLVPGSTERQRFEYNRLCIGNYVNNNDFKFHTVVGMRGTYIGTPVNEYKGLLFDIVFHIAIENKPTYPPNPYPAYIDYECEAVSTVETLSNIFTPKNKTIREFQYIY